MKRTRLREVTLRFQFVDGEWHAWSYHGAKLSEATGIFEDFSGEDTSVPEFIEEFASSVSGFLGADIENGDLE